jgi:hypothetical protein
MGEPVAPFREIDNPVIFDRNALRAQQRDLAPDSIA